MKTWLGDNVGDGAADSPRPLWPGEEISVGPKCVHLCLFTQSRWRNLALRRPRWFKLFGEFVTYLGGEGEAAAQQLIAALSKDAGVEYDPEYAQRMEDWQKERLSKYGFYGSGESSSPTRSFPLKISPRGVQSGRLAALDIFETTSPCGAVALIRS